jgi:hypothetical protein
MRAEILEIKNLLAKQSGSSNTDSLNPQKKLMRILK